MAVPSLRANDEEFRQQFVTSEHRRDRRRGAWLMLTSPVVGCVLFVMAMLTANPCGAFGHGCAAEGSISSIGMFLFAATFLVPLLMFGAGVASYRRGVVYRPKPAAK